MVAVLDRLVNPHWPYLPEKSRELGDNSDRIERAWSSVPDDPMNYDFFYHILDADEEGRQPKIDEQTLNELFNKKSMSCLRRIAESDDKVRSILSVVWNYTLCTHKMLILEPAFHMLSTFFDKKRCDSYGRWGAVLGTLRNYEDNVNETAFLTISARSQ